ncbi:twin-arginine translocation pathway signal [Halomonas sp. M20]|uniref:twin-arginine translocation pathway signal n=1 Tax=Halomonas sp. M20 TaxID=2763264 RepID=UPI001D0A8969|nr:twin-arginine translocation pathway signal [Halomonas sp. M20]
MNHTITKPASHAPGRRRFLRVLGLGTMAGAAAAGLGSATFVQAQEKEGDHPLHPDGPEYHETDHVRAFYATLRD